MKTSTFRKIVAAALLLVMLCTVAFGATISSIRFKKGVVTVEYYVGGEHATIMAYDADDPSNVIYFDQKEAAGSASFGVPEGFNGENVTVRVGGKNEIAAEATVSVTPTPEPTPDPESIEAGGIYGYVNKEDFTTTVINYDEQYITTEADYVESGVNVYGKPGAFTVLDEFSGADGVLYVEGESIKDDELFFDFDPITKGKAKFSIRYLYTSIVYANNGECPFFAVVDANHPLTAGRPRYAIKNCASRYTASGVPSDGMYFYSNSSGSYIKYKGTDPDSIWHTLVYEVDMDTKTFNVIHDGVEYRDNSFFDNEITELSRIYFKGAGETYYGGNYYIDEIKVMAVEADEYEKHTVTFYDEDGSTVIDTVEVKDGRRMEPIDAPNKRGYTFAGWYTQAGTAANFASITQDMNLYARYMPKVSVKFCDDEGNLLTTITVDYGGSTSVAGPSKEGYTFTGWFDEEGIPADLSNIREDMTVYAGFEAKPIVYYYDVDASGNMVEHDRQVVDYAGDAVPVEGPGPRDDGQQFLAWGTSDGSIADLRNIRGDRKVYAIYATQNSSALEDFTTFVERVNEAAGGTVMTENGFTPNGAQIYQGIQGDNGFVNESIYTQNAHGNEWQIKTAGTNKYLDVNNTYFWTFNNEDFRVYPVKDGSDIIRIGFEFRVTQWNSNDASGFGSIFAASPTGGEPIEVVRSTTSTHENRGYAVYNRNTGKWESIMPYNVNKPDTEWHYAEYFIDLANQKVMILLDGAIKASVPFDTDLTVEAIEYLRFSLLNGGAGSPFSLDNVSAETYTPSEILVEPTYYTVTFLAEDGETVLGTQTVREGQPAIYAGTPPTKEQTVSTVYTHTGWNPDVSSVYGDMSVTPVFTPSPRMYNVTFVMGDTKQVVSAAYGSGAVAPSNPTKTSDVQYDYVFSGWDVDFSNITGDLTVTALFNSVTRTYKVTFYDDDRRTNLGSQDVKYGEGIQPMPEPTKPADANGTTYTFEKWVNSRGGDVDLTFIKGTISVYAQYKANYKTRKIEIFWGDINGDGEVSRDDALALINYMNGMQVTYGDYTIGTVFVEDLLWGDINGDGEVSRDDALALINYMNGMQITYDYTISEKVIFEVPIE